MMPDEPRRNPPHEEVGYPDRDEGALAEAEVLNLGCGADTHDEARVWDVDIRDLDGVDEVVDLDTHPWPWEDGGFREVWAFHVFEHVEDAIGFLADCARVLEGGGLLRLRGPWWRHRNAYSDPTHRRALTRESMDHVARNPVGGEPRAYLDPEPFVISDVQLHPEVSWWEERFFDVRPCEVRFYLQRRVVAFEHVDGIPWSNP